MDEQPTFRPFLLSTLLLTAGGWIGLLFLLTYSLPTYWPRWGFFVTLFLAVSGTSLPLFYFINARFLRPYDRASVVREALWLGFYITTLAWLQLGRVLNFSLGLWFALGIVVIEILMRPRQGEETPSTPPAASADDAETVP